MKVSKAIEVLEGEMECLSLNPEARLPKAVKLGIEALKRVEDMRISPCTTADEILPGETDS